MKFTKMHGIGNDYVYVNGFEEKIPDPAAAARFVSDRHFGIGSDGLIIIQPSDRADCMMEMYNADGSRGQMCGNGIRCVAKYVYDNGIVDRTGITVDTLAGVKKLDLNLKDGKVDTVRVDMGAPILTPEKIPVDPGDFQYLPMDEVKPYGRMIRNAFIKVTEDTGMYGTCVSMGNPHCVVPVENLENFNIRYYGPLFEYNSIFPERINTEFITVTDRKNISMRVWERGSGETWACGTGACAAAVAGVLNDWTDRSVTVHLRGGNLEIEWNEERNTVFMTGSATKVFDGEIDL